jgi:outer membrane lipoprotein-sorting protein
MAGLPNLIGLLYRADWTRLSLSAEVSSDRYTGPGTLLVGPDGRWRLEYPVPGRGAGGAAADGYDGERGWSWRSVEADDPPPLPVAVDGAYPPVPELFRPSRLLGGYTLEELGPVTVAGRDAIALAATPRRDVLSTRSGHQPPDRIEVAVDAELGILLRRTETSGGEDGEVVTRTELTAVTMNPPEAADLTRFAPPPGSQLGKDPKETGWPKFSGPGWDAADAAAGGLGTLIRHVPHRRGRDVPDELLDAMPSPDPLPLGPGDGSPPPDEVLGLLYRGGDPRDLSAVVRQWTDPAAMAAWAPEKARAAGRSGVAGLLDAMSHEEKVLRFDTRLRVSGPDRYRLDYGPRRNRDGRKVTVCDGERRWEISQGQAKVGPAAPLTDPARFLADSSWLLRGRLSGGTELIYRGRPARQLRVTRAPGVENVLLGPLMIFFSAADAIVDVETGCLLRLLSYSGDALSMWWELDDISTEPVDPDAFQPHLPPGTRVVEETGNPWTDMAAEMPGLKGTAARAAVETITRTTSAISTARTFLEDLRNNPRPPHPPS